MRDLTTFRHQLLERTCRSTRAWLTSNRQPPHARRLLDLGRRAPAMDALRVSGAAEPLLRPAAAGGHPRLRVRRPTDPPVPPRLNIALAHPCYSGGGTRRLSLVVKGLTRWRMCRCGPVRSRAMAAPRRRGTPRSRGRPSSSRKLLPGHPLGFCFYSDSTLHNI
jgi:hypothetical protein